MCDPKHGRFPWPGTKVVFVVGKGGVGKTSVALAMGCLAARQGHRVLVIEIGEAAGLSRALGLAVPAGESRRLDDRYVPEGSGSLSVRVLAPDQIMSEYLVDHGFGRLSRRLASLGVVDAVATAIPGLAGILVLGRIKQLEREAELDLIIVDSPASGHAVSLMGGVEGLSDAARSGPVRAQADEVREMLADAKRAQVALVTLAEETPVNETVETAYKLEEDIGIKLGPVVVNGLVGLDLGPVGLDEERAPLLARLEQAGLSGDDALRAAAGIERSVAWTKGTMRRQLAQIERLGQALPLSQIWLRQFDPELPLADRAPWLAAEMTRGWRDRHERAGG